MEVNRTIEGTIFEGICAVLIIIMWILALVFYRDSPEMVPTHFDITGTPDAQGDKVVYIIMAAMGTIVTIICLFAAYKPDKRINLPVKVTNDHQITAMVLMVRVMAVEMALLFVSIIMMIRDTLKFNWMFYVSIALVILTTVYLTIKVYRLRH